jgi:hypothetical protein
MRWFVAMSVAACTSHPQPAPTVTRVMPIDPDLDLLMVVDNSALTADVQTVFAQNLTNMITAFDAFPNGRPNLHIGVIDTTVDIGAQGYAGCPSPDPNDNGLLQSSARVAGCTPPNGRFIVDVANMDGTRTTNYSGTLDQSLACIASVGGSGCGFVSPMLAIERALDGTTQPENAGFLRDDADLAIVILSSEDDCSIVGSQVLATQVTSAEPRCARFGYDCDQPVSETVPATYTDCRVDTSGALLDEDTLVAALDMLRDRSQISVALIAGDPTTTLTFVQSDQFLTEQPSCLATINGNSQSATPAIRLAAFADEYGSQGTFATFCQADYTQALVGVVQTVSAMMASCLPDGADMTDADSNNPGLQPACTVDDSSGTTRTPIPACPMTAATTPDPNGPRPCWWSAPDASCSTLALHIERVATPDPGADLVATCTAAH